MPPSRYEKVTKRIPLTPTANQRIKDFADGLGERYAEAIELLLDMVEQEHESDFEAGRRLRKK